MDHIIATINALATVILVVITALYAWSTAKILKESRLARKATERQAASSEESIRVLRQQIAEQSGVERAVIETVISGALAGITYWKEANLKNMTYSSVFPDTIELVPPDGHLAVRHAIHISSSVSSPLEAGLGQLRLAQGELEILRGATSNKTGVERTHSPRVHKHLDAAKEDLEKARSELAGVAGGKTTG